MVHTTHFISKRLEAILKKYTCIINIKEKDHESVFIRLNFSIKNRGKVMGGCSKSHDIIRVVNGASRHENT